MVNAKTVIARMTKKYGEGKIGFAKDLEGFGVFDRIPSGILGLDILLGGGIPRGTYSEVFGAKTSGKTTCAYNFIAREQEAGGVAAYLNYEGAYSKDWAAKQGVDTKKLIGVEMDDLEAGFDVMVSLAEEKAATLCVVDSLAAMKPKQEGERDWDQETIALQARELSKCFRKATGPISSSGMCILFINQIRTQIGSYGSPLRSPGGNALDHYKRVSFAIRRGKKDDRFKDKAKKEIGYEMVAKVMKNTIGNLLSKYLIDERRFDFFHNAGIDLNVDIANLAKDYGLVVRDSPKGSVYSYKERKFKGWQSVVDAVKEDKTLRAGLKKEILASGR